MKWFRSNIKHGSRLALLALALQFALSFGHFHGAAQAAAAVQPDTAPFELSYANGLTALDVAGDESAQQQPAPGHDSGGQPNDSCAICAVMSLASAMLFASPPLLQLPQAIDFLYRTTDAEFAHLSSGYPAFQSRAPPRFLTSMA
jgi:Protein of unknown function (DUF2946)